MPTIDDLNNIISKIRKVKYGDYVLSEDHNNLLDAISTMRDILYSTKDVPFTMLELFGKAKYEISQMWEGQVLWITSDQYANASVEALFQPADYDVDAEAYIFCRYVDKYNSYMVYIYYDTIGEDHFDIDIYLFEDGNIIYLDSVSNIIGTHHFVKAEVINNNINIYIDRNPSPVLTVVDDTHAKGKFAINIGKAEVENSLIPIPTTVKLSLL